MSFEDRIDDAEYEVRIPLCKTCKNRIKGVFDKSEPLKPIMSCSVLGEIPKDLLIAESKECRMYEEDTDAVKKYRDF